MKIISAMLFIMCFSLGATIEKKSTTVCTGKNVILTGVSPYLDRNLRQAKATFSLKNASEGPGVGIGGISFVDVDLEALVDHDSLIITVGKNKSGGSFTLKTEFWSDVGSGTVVQEVTSGFLTYASGTLKGVNEPVKCVRQ